MNINSLVVCIRNEWQCRLDLGSPSSISPVKGVIYTVDGIVSHAGKVWLTLVEIPNVDCSGEREHFFIEGFREIQPPMQVTIEELLTEKI